MWPSPHMFTLFCLDSRAWLLEAIGLQKSAQATFYLCDFGKISTSLSLSFLIYKKGTMIPLPLFLFLRAIASSGMETVKCAHRQEVRGEKGWRVNKM